MINITKNYRLLFNFTAITFSFLSTVSVNANSDNRGASCDVKGTSYIMCNDGKTHVIKDKTYNLTDSQKDSSSLVPVSVIYVEKKGTVIDASQVNILRDNSNTISIYGGYVKDDGKLILKESNFKGVPGLRAEKGIISMTDGSIKESSQAIYASGDKTDIALVRVGVEIELGSLNTQTGSLNTQNNLNINAGIVSDSGAMVRMSGGTVTFKERGSFLSRFGGKYHLASLKIEGKGKRENTTVSGKDTSSLPEAFEVLQGGNVHLQDSSLQVTDMHGFLIKNFSAFLNSRGQPISDYDLAGVVKKTNINIERSTISVQGNRGYGLYFSLLHPNKVAEYYGKQGVSEGALITTGKASVRLSNTTFTVPNGTAIYATAFGGYGVEASIELSDNARISGDLLLKAENNSFISIKAQGSSLRGGIYRGGAADVDLQLNRGSTWFIEKRKQEGLQESNSVVSSVSRLRLSDSTIVFNQDASGGYQTLRIKSDRYEEVYKAEGNVQITLGAFLNENGLFDPDKNDRILINGDVSGTTLVNMNDLFRNSEKKVHNGNVSKGSTQSISLIQVSGKAKEDSFKLNNSYTTVSGFPYQYHFRGYGPGSSAGKADSQNRLVEGSKDFWDFRLEAVYINPPSNSSKNVSVLPEPSSVVPSDISDSASKDLIRTSIEPSKSVTPTFADSAPPLIISSDTTDPTLTSMTSVSPETSESTGPISTPVIPSDTVDATLTDMTSTSTGSSQLTDSVSTPVIPSNIVDPTFTDIIPSIEPFQPADPIPADSTPSPVIPKIVDSNSKDSIPTSIKPSEPTDFVSTNSVSTPVIPSNTVDSTLKDMIPSTETFQPADIISADSILSSGVSSDTVDSAPKDIIPSTELSQPEDTISADSASSLIMQSEPAVPTSIDSMPTPSSPVDPTSTDFTPSPVEPTDLSLSTSIPVKPDIQPQQGIRAVVPQFPTYLLLPNALFYAGLMDLTTQNKKLGTMQSTSQNSLKSDENAALFLHGYVGSHHYASNISAFEYGYGAELDYTALETGVLLKEVESLCSRTFLGVLGTYGSLSLYPQDVEQSKKSTFDKWSIAAYGGLRHDTGFYMDGVFSYGLFKGDVLTLARGKTATLKGKQFSAALTSGQAFATGRKNLVFDPQVQFIYQNLQFDRVLDIDNIDVGLGKFDQWTMRVGGHLTKKLSAMEEVRIISLYSKLYLSHSFGGKQSVSFKHAFQLGAFGSSLETGFGFDARLSAHFALHGDVSYQRRFTKAGFSGARFSAGLRHLF